MAIEDDLQEVGFEYLTHWEIRKGRVKAKSTDWDSESSWLYAFLSEGDVKYIGIATSVLRTRFDGYSYQINDTVGKEILGLLELGREIRIYGAKRPDSSKQDLEIEESELIRRFDPAWNVRGKVKAECGRA